MEFPEEFEAWLRTVLASDVPGDVVAFSFNLFEWGAVDPKFGIELIGASEFDAEDQDWACNEAWVATPRSIDIPLAFSGSSWEICLQRAIQLVRGSLSGTSATADRLRKAEAVGVGFVDGELEVVWLRPSP